MLLTSCTLGQFYVKKNIEKGIKKPSIINGFRACGLHPFDANAADYSKCIAKTAAAFKVEHSEVDDSCEALHTSIMEPNSTARQEDKFV